MYAPRFSRILIFCLVGCLVFLFVATAALMGASCLPVNVAPPVQVALELAPLMDPV